MEAEGPVVTDHNPAVPAATVLLVRDGASGLEVLMVERAAGLGFAGGALVFPGGRVEAADSDAAWLNHADGLEGLTGEERATCVAAVREAYEEVGMVLARRAGHMADRAMADALNSHRGTVEADASLFLPLIAGAGLRLACDTLVRFARWVPPGGMHKRFDTVFWLTPVPAGQVALEDGNEATEALWTTPGAALAALADGSRKIIFPTARNLELLGLSGTVAAALDAARARPAVTVQPVMVERPDGRFLTIPDGLGYPVLEEPLEAALRN
jgi:8-oxo-dGTP pyrophosphatase MutT (NUDIX family)